VVAPLDIKFISDLFDCRAVVDGYVAAVLAARKDFDAGPLRRIVRDGRDAARKGESRRDLVMEFHTAQYEALGNQVLVRLMTPLLDHVQRVVTFVQDSTSNRHQRPRKSGPGAGQPGLRSQMDTWNEHAAILEAIALRKAGRARALARSHVERVKQVVIPYLVSTALPARAKSPAGQRRGAREVAAPTSVTFDSARLR